jgi:hypothetical protein
MGGPCPRIAPPGAAPVPAVLPAALRAALRAPLVPAAPRVVLPAAPRAVLPAAPRVVPPAVPRVVLRGALLAALPAMLLAGLPAGPPGPPGGPGGAVVQPVPAVAPARLGALFAAATVPVPSASGCPSRSGLLDRGPAARWRPARGLEISAWTGTDGRGHQVRLTVASADLGRVRLAAAAVAAYGDAAPTTSLTRGARRAVVGVNGDYFGYDWSGAAVPQGPVVIDGRVLRLPGGAHPAVGADASGRPFAGSVHVAGQVRLPPPGAGTAGVAPVLPIASVNDDTDAADAADTGGPDPVTSGRAVALVTPYLGRARPVRDRELIVRGGRVVAVGHRLSFGVRGAFGSGRAGRDDVLLAADGPAARTLGGLRRGSALRLRYAPVTAAGVRVAQAIGSGAVMVRGGRDLAPCASSGARSRPRTVVAWNAAHTRLWLLALDGRGGDVPVSRYGGTYRQVAELARALGASDAVMLDGGGSTTMAVRGAAGAVRRVDAPASAPQRPVPDGLVLIPR